LPLKIGENKVVLPHQHQELLENVCKYKFFFKNMGLSKKNFFLYFEDEEDI